MAVAPLAVMLYDRVFVFDSWRDAARERGWFYGALAATWVELGLLMWRWPRSTVGDANVSSWTYLVNQAAMIARYVGLAVWPRALVIDYGLPRAIGVADVLPQALLVLALLAGTVVALARWPAIGFLGAMFFLTLAPTSSVVPIASEVGAERRMYLPLAALSVLAVVLAWALVERLRAKWPARARVLTIAAVCAAAAAVGALAVRTAYRNRDYATPIALWESAVATRPHGRARFALATEYVSAGRHEEAVALLREAVPDYPDARAGLGAELFLLGQRAEAIDVLDLFIGANPSHPNRIPARILMGQALLAQGRTDEGASQFAAVLAADPSSVAANQGMATVARIRAARFLEQGNVAQASVQAREALRLNAGDADAHNVLGVTLAQQGQVNEAVREFQIAVRINPQHTQATRNLARATELAGHHASSAGLQGLPWCARAAFTPVLRGRRTHRSASSGSSRRAPSSSPRYSHVLALEHTVAERAKIRVKAGALGVGQMFVDLGLDVGPRAPEQIGQRPHHGPIESFGVDLDVAKPRQRVRARAARRYSARLRPCDAQRRKVPVRPAAEPRGIRRCSSPESEYSNSNSPSAGIAANISGTMRAVDGFSAALTASTLNTYGFGSSANTVPRAPTASAIGQRRIAGVRADVDRRRRLRAGTTRSASTLSCVTSSASRPDAASARTARRRCPAAGTSGFRDRIRAAPTPKPNARGRSFSFTAPIVPDVPVTRPPVRAIRVILLTVPPSAGAGNGRAPPRLN